VKSTADLFHYYSKLIFGRGNCLICLDLENGMMIICFPIGLIA